MTETISQKKGKLFFDAPKSIDFVAGFKKKDAKATCCCKDCQALIDDDQIDDATCGYCDGESGWRNVFIIDEELCAPAVFEKDHDKLIREYIASISKVSNKCEYLERIYAEAKKHEIRLGQQLAEKVLEIEKLKKELNGQRRKE